MIARPEVGEFNPFYAGYIQHIPAGEDVFGVLARQPDELRALLANVSDASASERPAPTEWSVKEVIGHINDGERVFAYRVLRISRGDATPLSGFDQDVYVQGADFNAYPLTDLIDEFAALRRANLLQFAKLNAAQIDRRGTASDS